jgi:hypothetical protein
MATIPLFHTGVQDTDFARSVFYLQSIATPSPISPAKVAANGNPATPLLPATVGVAGFFDSFQIGASGATETTIHAELAYCPRVFAATGGNLRAAILPLATTIQAAFAGTPSTIAFPPAPNLETYCFDRAVEAGFTPRAVVRTDGKPRIVINAVIAKTMKALLDGPISSGGGYPA